MSNSKINWDYKSNILPLVEPHTKAKHQILEDYVADWVLTLCANNPWNKKTVTLIDGFCGGGMYYDKENNQLWEGSPLRIIRAVERGLQRVKTEKSKPNYELNVKYIFIDNQQAHIECLKQQMRDSGLGHYINNLISNTTWSNKVDWVKEGRVILAQ